MVEDIVEILKLEEELDMYDAFGTSQYNTLTPVAHVSHPNSSIQGFFREFLDKSNRKCPPDVPQMKSGPIVGDPQVTAHTSGRNRRRKEIHNLFERKRANINDRVRELSTLLPRRNEQYFELARGLRYSTGQIPKALVNYIWRLKVDLEHSKKAEIKRSALEEENEGTRGESVVPQQREW